MKRANSSAKAFLRVQSRAAELLLGEISLPGSPVGLSLDPYVSIADAISAVKSLMNTLISAEPGQELCLTNVAWITLGYGLSLGVKLDILCTTCGISAATAIELRRSLDIARALRELSERLRIFISQRTDTGAGPHPLCQFLSRAEAIESWYLRHGPPSAAFDYAPSGNHRGPEAVNGTAQDNHRRDALPSHSHHATEGEGSFGTVDDQNFEFAYDPNMLSFEGLGFEAMDFVMDAEEIWNPFVFPNDAY